MPFNDTRGFVLPAACALVLALSGCGGGSSSTGTTPPPERSMAQLESEPVALPEGVTLATAGTFTVEPGRSVDRDGARFTCAAGGAACTVVVAERAGGGFAATVTGGRLTVARVQAAMEEQDDGQNGGMEERDWPDWPVADAAAARSLVGGSALSWSSEEIYNRIKRIDDTLVAGVGTRLESGFSHRRYDCLNATQRRDRLCSMAEYQPIMTYGGIPIVQGRARRDLDSGSRVDVIGILGFLNQGYFMVERHIGLDRASSGVDDVGAAAFELDSPWSVSVGRWRGVLIGTGNGRTSRLFGEYIIGDVDVMVELSNSRSDFLVNRYDTDVTFSNIRNINTGENVTLSRMEWDIGDGDNDDDCLGPAGLCVFKTRVSAADPTGSGGISVSFTGLNGNDEAFGAFETEEAVGAFGAKKQ